MARVLVLDIEKDEVREAECNELDDFYRELNAEPFEVVRRIIRGKPYDIFVDECGLLKDKPIVSAVNKDLQPMLVGNLLFANHNEDGETVSLSDEDIEHIKKHIVKAFSPMRPDGYWVLTECEF